MSTSRGHRAAAKLGMEGSEDPPPVQAVNSAMTAPTSKGRAGCTSAPRGEGEAREQRGVVRAIVAAALPDDPQR
jgi:hypothetical protein